jgi:hypothetical protein
LYVAIILILLAGAAVLFNTGGQRKARVRIIAGGPLALFTIFDFWFMGFWGEMLWFEALGFAKCFWSVVLTRAAFALAGALFGWFALSVLTYAAPKERKGDRMGSPWVAVLNRRNLGFESLGYLFAVLEPGATGSP